ncbi:MAG: TonB-dependent receptor [Sphingopyxis sp.]|nr:TonB-dependent receptor [Sphingopyxis sp.]
MTITNRDLGESGAWRFRVAIPALMLCTALPSAAAAAEDPQGDDAIIVTATKRSETIQAVPGAISALSAEDIERRGIVGVGDLPAQMPSVQIAKTPGVSAIYIRGIGSNIPGGGLSGGVATYVDGVYQAHPSMADLAQIDLERIEVLRGPQGTLYGRNATGGVVNFLSQQPSDKFEGYVKAGYGNFDEVTAGAMINLPVSERVRARMIMTYSDRSDGFIRNVNGGPDADYGRALAGRLRVAIDLAENARLNLILFGGYERQSPYARPTNPSPALGPLEVYPHGTFTTAQNRPGIFRRRVGGGALVFDWDLGSVQLKSTTGFTHHAPIRRSEDNDTTNVDFATVSRGAFISDTFTQQLDLSGEAGRIEWLAGLFYMNDKMDQDLNVALPLFGAAILSHQDNETNSLAGYADVTYHANDRLKLIGGVRQSRDKIDSRVSSVVFGVPNACTPLRPEFSSTTWRAGLQFEPDSDRNLYGTVTRGFKAGGVNSCTSVAGVNQPNVFAPEKVTAYELGYKTRLLDRRLSISLAAFYYDYTDLQVFQVNSANFTSDILNAAAATVKGAEIEATARPSDRWTFDLGATFLDATYDHFSNIDDLNPAAGLQNLAGKRLSLAPKSVVSVGAEYVHPLGDLGTLTLRVDARFSSKVYFREFNSPADAQKAFGVGNLYLSWDLPRAGLTTRLFVRNITDQAYYQSLGSTGVALGTRVVSYAPRRQYGFDVTKRF